MQPILESLGITDRTVKQLSQGEKEILRYIATLKQAEVAMGDYANTVESPSNQMKVFKQQLIEAKAALTSLFMGTFANILPYVNAFLMVVKEVSKAIATMFDIDINDYNSGIASQEDAYADLSDSIDDTVDSLKELKRQTLGFDQINNINESKNYGNGASSLTGGIDQRLLDSIKSYENGMKKVNMKANEIRREIMDWLGFTEYTNKETGEVYYKFEKLTGGTVVATSVIGLLVGGTLIKGISSVKRAVDLLIGKKAVGTGTTLSGGAGLAGLLPFLVAVAGIWTISLYVEGVEKIISSMQQLHTEISKNTYASAFFAKQLAIMSGNFNDMSVSGELSNDVLGKYTDSLKRTTKTLKNQFENLQANNHWWAKTTEGQKAVVKELDIIIGSYKTFYEQGRLNDEQTQDYIKTIEQQKKMYEALGLNTDSLNRELGILRGELCLLTKSPYKINVEMTTKVPSTWEDFKNLQNSSKVTPYVTKANGGVYSNGSWKNIPQYANGGIPSHGSMFIAGEKGSEIVGNVNGRTEVLNQSQIASAIYSAVLSAMSQAGNSSQQIDVHVHTDEGTVVDRINQKTKQTGICPINIPA